MPSTYSPAKPQSRFASRLPTCTVSCLPERHAGEAERDLAGDELASAQRALVIEQDAGAGMEAVRLAVVHHAPMGEELGHAIGAARVEGRLLVLRGLLHLAEHLGGRGLIEARAGADLAHGFEQAQHAERVDVGGVERLLEGQADEALRREIVDFVRLELVEHVAEVAFFEQLHVDQLHVAGNAELLEPANTDAGGTAKGADDAIAAREQRPGEIGSVLTGDAGDQRGLRHRLRLPLADRGGRERRAGRASACPPRQGCDGS